MNKTYDSGAQSGYLRFSREPISATVPVNAHIVYDVDATGMPIGFEFIDIPEATFHAMTEHLSLVK